MPKTITLIVMINSEQHVTIEKKKINTLNEHAKDFNTQEMINSAQHVSVNKQ